MSDGVEWTARPIGLGQGSRGSGPLSLIQLEFHRAETEEAVGGRHDEATRPTAIVAARSLDGLTDEELERALAVAQRRKRRN